MTTEQTRPAPPAIEAIHARYQEIAPGPTSATPDPALAMARWLTFAAQRGFTRMTGPHVPLDHGEMLLMLARFEALHFLAAARAADPAEARRLAREALDAAEDGGGVGEWLYEHGQALGVDTGEIGRLADREAELEAAGKGGQAPDALDLSRTVLRLEGELASARAAGDDAAAVAAGQEREARQHARDMAAEDGDLDNCEPTL